MSFDLFLLVFKSWFTVNKIKKINPKLIQGLMWLNAHAIVNGISNIKATIKRYLLFIMLFKIYVTNVIIIFSSQDRIRTCMDKRTTLAVILISVYHSATWLYKHRLKQSIYTYLSAGIMYIPESSQSSSEILRLQVLCLFVVSTGFEPVVALVLVLGNHQRNSS